MLPSASIVPDLQILVSEEPADPKTLSFRAAARDPGLGFGTFLDFGKVRLRLDPIRYLDGLFSKLQCSGRAANHRLEDAGVRLFEELLPFELRRRLWRSRHAIRSVFIVTSEAWIPWELLKLQDPESDEIGPFFAEAFLMGRWLSAGDSTFGAALELPLRRLGVIAPGDSLLLQAGLEKQELLGLRREDRQVLEISAEPEAMADAMAAADLDGWHFCGHGQVEDGSAEPWYLCLESLDSFEAFQLHGRARRLGNRHPLVFLNACYGGRAGYGLTGLGGLPASFLRVGAGAFIGPLWQVSDVGAALFARVFYATFLAGGTLGEAALEARMALRRANPDDPTWLAYLVLGHPLATCRIPAQEPAVETVELGSPGPAAPALSPAAGLDSPRRNRAGRPGTSAVVVLFGMPLIFLAVLVGMAFLRVSTPIRVEGRAVRISGLLSDEGARLFGETLAFQRITLSQLAAAELDSEAVGPPGQSVRHPTLTISTLGSGAGHLGRLRLAGSRPVVWEAERMPKALALRVEGTLAETFYEFPLPWPSRIEWPGNDAALSSRSRTLRAFPSEAGLVLEAELPFGDHAEPNRRLFEKGFELSDLAFGEPSAYDGSLRSSLREASIFYSGHPEMPSVQLGRDGVLVPDPEDKFRVTLLELDPVRGELVFALEGTPGLLLAGEGANLRDVRLSALRAWAAELGWASLVAFILVAAVVFRQRKRAKKATLNLPRRDGWSAGLATGLLVTGLLSAASPSRAGEETDYQERSHRFEGRRRLPVGGTEIELIGAMTENSAPRASLPERLELIFYLQDTTDTFVVVRERLPQKNYWLDRVSPSRPFLVRSLNRFDWPTAEVLRPVRLEAWQLMALIRLGYSEPRIREEIAPAQLAAPGSSWQGGVYRLTFRTSRPAEVRAELHGCDGVVEPRRLTTARRVPFEIRVRSTETTGADCRLVLQGEMSDNAARLFQSVEWVVPPLDLETRGEKP